MVIRFEIRYYSYRALETRAPVTDQRRVQAPALRFAKRAAISDAGQLCILGRTPAWRQLSVMDSEPLHTVQPPVV